MGIARKGEGAQPLTKCFGALFIDLYIWAKCQKGGGMKAIIKDLEHFERFYIVEFHKNSFKFGQKVLRGGGGMPKIL